MIFRLHQIEVDLVEAIEIGNIIRCDVDLRFNLFIQHLFGGQVQPDFAANIRQGHSLGLQLVIELLVCIGRFHLGDFGVHLGIRRHQVQLFRLLPDHLLADPLLQDFQFQRGGLVCRRRLLHGIDLGLVILFHFRFRDRMTVYRGHHIRVRRARTSGEYREEKHSGRSGQTHLAGAPEGRS